MKRIRMTFTVCVDDVPTDCTGQTYTMEEATKDLYDHIYMWELNNHGTVEVESESIEDAKDME